MKFEGGFAVVAYISNENLDIVLAFHVVGLNHLQFNWRNALYSNFQIVVNAFFVTFVHLYSATCIGQRVSVIGCATIVLRLLGNQFLGISLSLNANFVDTLIVGFTKHYIAVFVK